MSVVTHILAEFPDSLSVVREFWRLWCPLAKQKNKKQKSRHLLFLALKYSKNRAYALSGFRKQK